MKRRAAFLKDLDVSISLAGSVDMTRSFDSENDDSDALLQNHTIDMDDVLGLRMNDEHSHVYAAESSEMFPSMGTAASNFASLSGTANIPATIDSTNEREEFYSLHDNRHMVMKEHREQKASSPPLCINEAMHIERSYVTIPSRLLYYEDDQFAMSQHPFPFHFNSFQGQRDGDGEAGEQMGDSSMPIEQSEKDSASIKESAYVLAIKRIREEISKKHNGEQEPVYSLKRLPQFHTLFSTNENLIVGCRDVQSEL